jgi:(1->4)-alpha-D-glucan 1-alpha-D-glucosylmutase
VHPQPICSYRLQLTPDFGFDEAASIVDYLARLGVSHVYLSPITQAAPGSTHGYDGCDPSRLSAELGGPTAYERLCGALEAAGMGQIVDIVPNHMAFAIPQNRWLDDVLCHGPASRYASYFDLHWSESDDGTPYIELPILSDEYDDVLASGDIHLVASDDGIRVRYGDFALPLRPGPKPWSTSIPVADLDALLQRQHYRLVYWRTADERLSYRRFFDVTGLIGLRVEDEAVFDDAYALVLDLVRSGRVSGLRIDHIDGLRDPEGYLQMLRSRAPDARILVEKILGSGESLPQSWPVDGTTGYDFLNVINGLFVDPQGEHALTATYAAFSGLADDFGTVLETAKRGIVHRLFGAELAQLVDMLRGVLAATTQGWSDEDFDAALTETLVALPYYRTYIRPGETPSPADTQLVAEAVAQAKQRVDSRLAPLLDELGDVLTLRHSDQAATELALRFQQLSGPVMAKGGEDTAFYNYNRLISLNEVGGDPSRFGTTVADFHAFCARTARRLPQTMLATATHDTKRGEDARLRIHVLSQMPQAWADAVSRWSALNQALRTKELPDRNVEYLFYQTLVGAWPLGPDRAWEYMLKAAREAKAFTSWREPDEAYEAALQRFVQGALENAAFASDLAAFMPAVTHAAEAATLAQTLLKLTAPGVPDLYQGTELLDLNLVDPDNRRPVDYRRRREMLEEASALATATEVIVRHDPALTKLWLTYRVLQTRRQHVQAFEGDYRPLEIDGAEDVVAFSRAGGVIAVASLRGVSGQDVTIRLPEGAWLNILTQTSTRSGVVPLAEVLGDLNVALLVRDPAS